MKKVVGQQGGRRSRVKRKGREGCPQTGKEAELRASEGEAVCWCKVEGGEAAPRWKVWCAAEFLLQVGGTVKGTNHQGFL
jgi:hypothetical protein